MSFSLIHAQALRKKYPNCRPIIIKSDEKLLKTKIIIDKDWEVRKLMSYIRTNNKLKSHQAYFFFAGDKLLIQSDTINDLFIRHATDNGFLYITVRKESTFG